jgi:hypothetical protein
VLFYTTVASAKPGHANGHVVFFFFLLYEATFFLLLH